MNRFFALTLAALALVAVSCEEVGNDKDDQTVEVTEANLQGTWEGSVEHDFAQGYPQTWRIKFEGKTYTSWHTHLTAGTINDDVQGLKTVGNKEKGTWEYSGGTLVLTPAEQYASYYETLIGSSFKGVYRDYNTETMESSDWYATSQAVIQSGVERDLQDEDGTCWYISKWKNVKLTKTTLTIKINMDTFVLTKK